MVAFFYLEASQPCGRCYRLALGCVFYPQVASVIVLLSRLF